MPPSLDFGQALIESYAVNERMNQIVIEHLAPAAWRARLPGTRTRTRTIAAIFSHMHNMRRKWLRLSAPHISLPAPLHAATCTQEQTSKALAESGARCCEMLAGALTWPEPRVPTTFLRDGWAKPWPAGPTMAAYMITHDAHHRGQVCLLAHQQGFPLPVKYASGIWVWEKLSKECSR